MSLVVWGLLSLLGLIFAAMILVGLRWCGGDRPTSGSQRKRLGPPAGPAA